jgi:hypothetical protein
MIVDKQKLLEKNIELYRNIFEDQNILEQGTIEEVDLTDGILEFKLGGMLAGAKYIQRIGSPGHYIYIYPNKTMEKMGRKMRFFYARFTSRHKKWLGSFSANYGATSMNIRPKNWHTAIVDMHSKERGLLQMNVNLAKHSIYSYRSQRKGAGTSASLSMSKRKGLLRYR